MATATEPLRAHPVELQVWATRSLPPWGEGFRAWLGFGLSLAIRAFTLGRYGGRYSHILFRCGGAIWEAAASGVRDGEVTEYDQAHLVVDAYHIVAREADEAQMINWLANQVGIGYDFAQLGAIAAEILGLPAELARHLQDDDLPVCSTLWGLAYLQIGLDIAKLLGCRLWQLTPDHIHILHKRLPARCVYRGRVQFSESPHA